MRLLGGLGGGEKILLFLDNERSLKSEEMKKEKKSQPSNAQRETSPCETLVKPSRR